MADRCWRCATELIDDTAFCATCGAKVRADAPDLEFFTDVATEQPAPVEAKPAGGSRWLLVGGVGLIVAIVAFFALTSTDDEPSTDPFEERAEFDAVDEPDVAVDGTANTTPSTIPLTFGEVLAPLSWAAVTENIEGFPLAVLEHGGSAFVIATTTSPTWSLESGTAHVYEYTHGGDWIAHGQPFPDGAQVLTATAHDGGLLAAGLSALEEPTVWRSTDGVTWEAEPLPATAAPDRAARPTHIIEKNGVIVVGSTTTNPWNLVQQAATAQFGDEVVGFNGVDWEPMDDTVTLRGPFGLTLATPSIADLGLDGDALDDWYSRPQPSPIWVFDAGAWASNVVGGSTVSISATDDGAIHLVTTVDYDEISTYRNGAWELRATNTGAFRMHAWSDGFIGQVDAGRLAVYDADFNLLRETVPPAAAGGGGALDQLAIGGLGLAASFVTWDGSTPEPTDPPERVVILRDGYRLEADPIHLLRLSRDGEEVLRIDGWSGDGGYRADLDSDEPRIVMFDPETGEDLVSFTLDELRELEAAGQVSADNDVESTVLYSLDAETWLGGDIKLLDPDQPAFAMPYVGDERLYLAVVTQREGAALNSILELEFTLYQVEPPGQ